MSYSYSSYSGNNSRRPAPANPFEEPSNPYSGGNTYRTNPPSANPFDEPSYPTGATRRTGPASTNPFDEPEPRQPTEQERIVGQILDVQQESKNSTQRSLALLYQSEEVGSATAEQLIEQGEKLTRIEGSVTKIDSDLKQSQKHLNGIKSVFGGITNWWQARKEKGTKEEPSMLPSNNANSGLRNAMKKSESEHSTLSSRTTSNSNQYRPQPRMAGTSVQTVIEQNEQDIEEDLGQMSVLTERLKYMALALGDEVDKQNSQIDNITSRVGRTESTMTGQNKQMTKILKK